MFWTILVIITTISCAHLFINFHKAPSFIKIPLLLFLSYKTLMFIDWYDEWIFYKRLINEIDLSHYIFLILIPLFILYYITHVQIHKTSKYSLDAVLFSLLTLNYLGHVYKWFFEGHFNNILYLFLFTNLIFVISLFLVAKKIIKI